MFSKLKKFAKDDSGAVTVDYIALTAVLIATGLALTTTVGTGIIGVSEELVENLRNEINCGDAGNDDNTGGSSSSTFGNSC